jgi:hypothetical protein
MINNLINYNFYDITKQWNCAGVFFAALKSYNIKIDEFISSEYSDQIYVTRSGKWIVVPSHSYLDFLNKQPSY